ncbi:contractile injection system protein, VgrG/Pvc8 family, partial [Saprospiraceae bacterium]|nr:contractile injection system protein, VgrG/Pvc8 family [Saprospiraceae bacterium]
MAKSPLKQKTHRISYKVTVSGTVLASKYHVVFVEVDTKLNKLPYATVEILDGDTSEQKFEKLDDLNLNPGDDIKIEVGYHEQNKVIFEGIITSIGTGGDFGSHGRTTIEATDKCKAMTVNRKSRYFKGKKDSQIVSEIIRDYSGVTSKQDSTPTTHKKIVQYASSDWDFLLSRATVSKRVIVVEKNKYNFVEPGGSSSVKLEYGFDIVDFNINVDASNQLKKVTIKGWNPSTHSFQTGSSSEPGFDKQGNSKMKGDKLASNLKYKDETLRTTTPMETSELNDYAA